MHDDQTSLILSRKAGESIVIDGNITVTVTETQRGKVRLRIAAPQSVKIVRAELLHGGQASGTQTKRNQQIDRLPARGPRARG